MRSSRKMVVYLLLTILSGLKEAHGVEAKSGVYEPVGKAIHMLASLTDSSKVIYLNGSYLNDDDIVAEVTSPIVSKVLNSDHRYFIDFTTINDNTAVQQAKQRVLDKLGILPTGDLIIITKHNQELMYTVLKDSNDPKIKLLDAYKDSVRVVPLPLRTQTNQPKIPVFSFYINAEKEIPNQDCTITWRTSDGPSKSTLCDKANISLIYHITMRRSLAFTDRIGNTTPDSKIVSITLGADNEFAEGVGIHLNSQLGSKYLMSHGIPWPQGGHEAEWTSTAIARNYSFTFQANNKKTHITSTIPHSNLNSNVQKTEAISLNYGIANVDPTQLLSANYSHNELTSFTFDLSDYQILKNSESSRKVTFRWQRDLYPSAASIQRFFTEGISARLEYPGDLSKINPIGYSGFTPAMAVHFNASPKARESSLFTISSKVDVTGFRFRSYVVPFFGVRRYYSKDEDNQHMTFSESNSFSVNWEHPVFLGGIPVNLQLGNVNNRCLSVGKAMKINLSHCSLKDPRQSFIYDNEGRYVSVSYSKYCLDGTDLKMLHKCTQKLSQRWKWNVKKNMLINKFRNQHLAYNNKLDLFLVFNAKDQNLSTRVLTQNTDLFHKIKVKYQ